MKEKNEIIQKEVSEISQNNKIIIKIGQNIENEKVQELNEENLYYFFFSKELYNEKGTKLLNKEKYIPFLNILNEYIKEKNDFILLFFNNYRNHFNTYIIFFFINAHHSIIKKIQINKSIFIKKLLILPFR